VSLVALPSLVERHITEDGSDISWSPDATRLAYQSPDGVHVQTIASGRDVRLPAGDPLAAPAAWSGDGSTLALPVQHAATGAVHVDLAMPDLVVRYSVPGLSGAVAAPALSPDGSLLAVHRDGDDSVVGTWTVRLRGGDATPRRLGSDLTPVAFADGGTLLAAERPVDGDSGLVRVSIADGGRDRLGNQPLASDLSSAVVAPSGRQVAYLLPDADGVRQAAIENVDGSNPAFLTTFPGGGYEAVAVAFTR
jgi:Tol biopolymer transport system component